MAEVPQEYFETVNKIGRIGTLSTADAQGIPNVGYFGSPRLMEDGTFVVGLTPNRTLKNLEQNPNAVFFCVEEGPVTFQTKGCRIYLKVKEIAKEGDLLDQVRKRIAEGAGEDAAKMIVAAVAFEVTGFRPLVDMG